MKEKLSIVFIKKMWIVLDWKDKKVLKKFLNRDEAYHYSVQKSHKVYVHKLNGQIDFVGKN